MRYTLLLALACVCLGACHASIDQSPQKVGPKYFFGLDGGSPANVEQASTEKPGSNEVEPELDSPIPVRRVFLMPAFTRTIMSSSSGQGDDESSSQPQDDFPRFMRPSSPLMPLLFPQHFMRDFSPMSGGPSSSEEPIGTAATSSSGAGEREETGLASRPINPLDLLLDMMTKALRSHAMMPPPGLSDESTSSSNNNADKSLTLPATNKTQEQSHETVVTINGRRYLQKMVVNKHIGDNLIFLTRRLVFTPLDEPETMTTTTTEAPSSSSSSAEPKSVTTEAPLAKEATTEQAKQSTTEPSTRMTEETTPTTGSVAKIQPSSTASDKVIEAELVKPAVSTQASATSTTTTTTTTSDKPTAELTSSQPGDKPIPSSEPDFVRV